MKLFLNSKTLCLRWLRVVFLKLIIRMFLKRQWMYEVFYFVYRQKLIKNTQERIHFPLISYDSDYKPQINFSDNVDCMDLNFAPKLRFKHNARKPWINESKLIEFLNKEQRFRRFLASSSKMITCANQELIQRLK